MSPRTLLSLFAILLLPATVHAQANFKAIHDAGDKQYQEWINKLDKDKLHPVLVSGAGAGGAPRFAAIASDEPVTDWIARHDLSTQGFQKEFDNWVGKGYRLLSLSGYANGNTVNFAGVWVKDGFQGGWEAHHEMTPAQYQEITDKASKKGMRPLQISGFMAGKSHRLAAIFIEDNKDFIARHDLTAEQYQKNFDEWTPKGHRPVCVAGYPTAFGPRFALVMVSDKTTQWDARHNLTAAEYQKEFDKWTAKGYRPVQISGYPADGQIRFACVFAKAGPPPVAKKPPPITGDAVPELAAFDAAMQKFMQERGILAGTLAVMKNGKLVLAHGYGYLDSAETHLCGPQTPMRIASVSKPLTLAALLKLLRESVITLNTKAFAYLGIKAPAGKKMDSRLLDITIKDLIDHKGGWDRDKAGDPMFKSLQIAKELGKPGPATADDIIHYMAGQPLQFDPGSKSVYSNFGYCVLGRVIEKASGKKYIDYLHEAVTKPLGLTSIQLGHTLPKQRNPKEPVYLDSGAGQNVLMPGSKTQIPAPDGTFYLEAMDAHGGLIASAPDLVRFLQAYWMSGQPRKDGESFSYNFFGSLPGTWTMVVQRKDINMAALFNQRSDPSGLSYDSIQSVLNKAADSVKSWPK